MAASRPTLADVARLAEVSVPTVSKAISGRTDVAESTRRRVLSAMDELGYSTRGGLASGPRHGIYDLLIGGVGTLWAMEMIRGAEEAAAKRGMSLVVTSSVRESFSLDAWIDAVLEHRSVGVIISATLTSGDLSRLTEARIPIVRVDSAGGGEGGGAEVGATNWAGMRTATTHLVEQGHTRIGFIGGGAHVTASQDRLEGYNAALRRAGIDLDADLVCEGDFMLKGGERAAARLLALNDPPTAIVAGSDLAAMGVYHVAAQRGLRVPDDLSVVGFDDTILCEYLSPALTSVRQPLAQMAEQAVGLLEDMARDGRATHTRIELSTSLVVRDSTARAPRQA